MRPPVSREIVFGCVPDTDDAQTRVLLTDFCALLGQAVGARVHPHRSPSPEALASAFSAGRVNVAWVSPVALLTMRELADAVPLVSSVREGVARYHGVIFVRDDAPYRSAADLRGAVAAWVAPTSASGYLFPRLALASYGFDPRTFFGSELFFGSHGNVARAVLTGRADVGGIYAVFEDGNPMRPLIRAAFLDLVPDRTGRTLLTTEAIPSDLIVASTSISVISRNLLAGAFESLMQDPLAETPVKHVLGADGFVRHDPAALAALREQVATGRELGLID